MPSLPGETAAIVELISVTCRTAIRCLLLVSVGILAIAPMRGDQPDHSGAAIFTKLCADCHGKNGEGVKDEYDEPLVGERSLEALTRRVKRTMPDDDPGTLTAEEAAEVSAYIYDAFYSPKAQARLH